MKSRGCLLLSLLAVLLAIGGYDRFTSFLWVGSTDLEIEFIVVDSETGEPIPRAEITVQSGGGFYSDEDQQRDSEPFILRTDENGTARRVCHGMMCSGSRSGLGFTDTFAAHMPSWLFRVASPGYQETDRLWTVHYSRTVHRTGHRQSRAVVRVPLQRS